MMFACGENVLIDGANSFGRRSTQPLIQNRKIAKPDPGLVWVSIGVLVSDRFWFRDPGFGFADLCL
jgi:hypothetical protein